MQVVFNIYIEPSSLFTYLVLLKHINELFCKFHLQIPLKGTSLLLSCTQEGKVLLVHGKQVLRTAVGNIYNQFGKAFGYIFEINIKPC